MRRTGPIILEVLCHMMFSDQFISAKRPHHGMQVTSIVRVRRIVLCDASDRNVKRVDLVMIWAVFERDREAAIGTSKIAVVYIVDRQLFEIADRSVRLNNDQIAHKSELLPQC